MKSNHERFGFSRKQWDEFKKESRAIMIEVARQRGMITYGELANRMTTTQVEPHDMVLWEIIGDVARDEEAANRGLLSVVVVHKHGDMEPGFGFYELAKHYGRKATDKTKCFIDEMHNVHRIWSVNTPKNRRQSANVNS